MSDDLARIEQHNEMVEQANRLLSEVVTAQDATKVIREAEAARVLARQVKLGEAAVNHAQAVKIRAEIRLADVIDATPEMARPGDNQHTTGCSESEQPAKTTLADLGVDRARLHEARELRSLGTTSAEAEERVLEEATRATSQGRELSRSGLLRMAQEPRRAAARATHNEEFREMQEWAESITPDDYDPAEDHHSSAVQVAILSAARGVEQLRRFTAEDVRRALNHSNPKVRNIILPSYTDDLRLIVETADRFRELLP